MDLRSELLKSIWYGFTALDLERSGKVSKSQLKVSGKPDNQGTFVVVFYSSEKLTHSIASFPTTVQIPSRGFHLNKMSLKYLKKQNVPTAFVVQCLLYQLCT